MSKGKVTWKSPSNIAIVKYWGKFGNQLPKNTSISFTLENAHSITTLTWTPASMENPVGVSFLFEGHQNLTFENRIQKFIAGIQETYFPFLKDYFLFFESSNSFPHSSGIASSASGMSAIALCLCSMEQVLTGNLSNEQEFFHKASVIARLGSGSASRSVFPIMALWGEHPDISGSSNEFAIPFSENIHPVFNTFHDDILIISHKEKSVSSTAGHHLMKGNPFAEARYQQANNRIKQITQILKQGEIDAFGLMAEAEALTLHALMMCSEPSYMLMEPASLIVIKKIQQFRKETKLPVYFTLDAGPNIHILYPGSEEKTINTWISQELTPHCAGGKIIRDKVGKGPIKI